jgi:hypothetical protein
MISQTVFCSRGLASLLLLAASAAAQGWPEIFDPLVLRTLHLEMSDQDWQTIQHDESFDIEVPAMFALEGEEPILVSIRRKSADPLTQAPGFDKVSYKIDINELVSGQNWHGLRAVSLDNGDDQDPLSEGLAWYLHRVAAGPEGYGYDPGLASWVRLVINGVDTGVYVNAEQRDKRFLENRGLWVAGETWLYEVEDLQGVELDEGGPEDSPTVMALCYSPFASPSSCATPGAATLAAQLPALVDMQGLLAYGAVDSFSGNPDGIFSHGKNFYFADWLSGQPRLYFPWDLDSALGGGANSDVYAPQSAYSAILLEVPAFRAQYSQILNDLLCGPLAEAQLHAFLDALEPVLSAALAADPNSQIDDVAGAFAARKQWFSQRIQSVASQVEGFVPCSAPADPWTDLGGGTAGIQGAPSLEGTGPLSAGSTLTLDLTSGPPAAPMLLWIATAPTPFAMFGGTVHALPSLATVFLSTSAAGSFSGSTIWPAGVPADLDITFQCLCQDATSVYGLTLSNGLRGTTP